MIQSRKEQVLNWANEQLQLNPTTNDVDYFHPQPNTIELILANFVLKFQLMGINNLISDMDHSEIVDYVKDMIYGGVKGLKDCTIDELLEQVDDCWETMGDETEDFTLIVSRMK